MKTIRLAFPVLAGLGCGVVAMAQQVTDVTDHSGGMGTVALIREGDASSVRQSDETGRGPGRASRTQRPRYRGLQ